MGKTIENSEREGGIGGVGGEEEEGNGWRKICQEGEGERQGGGWGAGGGDERCKEVGEREVWLNSGLFISPLSLSSSATHSLSSGSCKDPFPPPLKPLNAPH